MSALAGVDIQLVAVGIESYALGRAHDLDGAAADALRFVRWARGSLGVPVTNVHLFLSPLSANVAPVAAELALDGTKARAATRVEIRDFIIETVPQLRGQLLLWWWGGHGVVTRKDRRQLFYADANESDIKNLAITEALDRLRSTEMRALPNQIFFIDSCATYFNSLPHDEIPTGATVRPGVRQFASYSAALGQTARQEGKLTPYAKILFPLLAQQFPQGSNPGLPELEKGFEYISGAVSKAFAARESSGDGSQTPVDYEWNSWSGKSGGFGMAPALEKLLALGLRQGTAGTVHALQKPRQVGVLDRHKLFGGRSAELKALDAFVRNESLTHCFVHGSSGMGKSALIANWIRTLEVRGARLAYHFVSRFDAMADEEIALRNLCEQLANLHGLDGQLPGSISQLRAVYHQLIRMPSLGSEPILVIIDGLDEADRWTPNFELAPDVLPFGVRMIFSARDQADVDVLHELRIARDHVYDLPLTKLDAPRLEELLRQLGGKLGLADDPRMVAAIASVSDGDPFYLRYLLEDLAVLPQVTETAVRKQPYGLDAYLKGWYQQLSNSLDPALMSQINLVLSVLVANLGRLERSDLREITSINDMWLGKTLSQIARFVDGSETSGYALCHARFRDFLLRYLASDVKAGRGRLIDWGLIQKQSRGGEVPLYVLRYLGKHLFEVKDMARLCALFDRDWLDLHFARLSNYQYVLADLDFAATAVWNTDPRSPAALARIHAIRQLTRWHVSLFSDLDLATLTMLGDEEKAIEIARNREQPLDRIAALVSILHKCRRNRSALIAEIMALAQRGGHPEANSLGLGAVALALAVDCRLDAAHEMQAQIDMPEYRANALAEFAKKAELHGDHQRAIRFLDESMAIIRGNLRPQFADTVLATMDLMSRLNVAPVSALELALECSITGHSGKYKRVVRNCEIAKRFHDAGETDRAYAIAHQVEWEIRSDASDDFARMQVRLAATLDHIGDSERAEQSRVLATRSINDAAGAYEREHRTASTAHEYLHTYDFTRAEALILKIADSYERSSALFHLLVRTWERGDREAAVNCLERISDPTHRTRAASDLAWRFAEADDAARSRVLFFRMLKEQSYVVRGVSSDATANWMKAALLYIAQLLAGGGDGARCRAVMRFAENLGASRGSGRPKVLYRIAEQLAALGDVEGAIDAVQKARDHTSTRNYDSEAAVALALLENGEKENAQELLLDILHDDRARTFQRARALGMFLKALRARGVPSLAAALEAERDRILRDAAGGQESESDQALNLAAVKLLLGLDETGIDEAISARLRDLEKLYYDLLIEKLAYCDQADTALRLCDMNPEGSVSSLESVGKSYARLNRPADVFNVAVRLIDAQRFHDGSKLASRAAELWMLEGRRDLCGSVVTLLESAIVTEDGSDPTVFAMLGRSLAFAGNAAEATKVADMLPDSDASFGIIGPNHKVDLAGAFVRCGNLDHAAQMLAKMIAAPDSPDVWLTDLAEALCDARAKDVPRAMQIFLEAARVIAWVREDWKSLVSLIESTPPSSVSLPRES